MCKCMYIYTYAFAHIYHRHTQKKMEKIRIFSGEDKITNCIKSPLSALVHLMSCSIK